ncbi:MAG: RdgB/HAM1 family non-canonical purine NTP pyrophosphatase [Planctomycetales bacterium]|nr:RdgB/HAM1 family non-canonical purine NTP pyrophosphatase [Planctomycetales bacterium]
MTNAQPLLVLGTHNRKKGRELVELLAPLGIEVRTLADFPQAIEVVEDGASFAENSGKKAAEQAQHLGQWVLGEDSGLVVDALDGRPGIYSARYAGEHASDEENNQLLLEELAGVSAQGRTAHYVSHIAVADPSGTIRLEATGRFDGRIAEHPAGSAGFGYDPLFVVPEYHRTVGQLGAAIKSVISHRARAYRQLLPQLAQLTRGGDWRT